MSVSSCLQARGAGVIDLDVIAYATLGVSVAVSVSQIGGWLLNADPRTILAVSRCSAVLLAALTPVVLLWLAVSGRSTSAMLLTALVLPVFVEGARRWRDFLGPIADWLDRLVAIQPGRSAQPLGHDLPEHCAAVLKLYLEQDGWRLNRMSRVEALAVLGLEYTADGHEIREAHRRLERRVALEAGGTHYLVAKINEAKDVLLET
jgi:hypothetical protein